jgi:hypothetical protein
MCIGVGDEQQVHGALASGLMLVPGGLCWVLFFGEGRLTARMKTGDFLLRGRGLPGERRGSLAFILRLT